MDCQGTKSPQNGVRDPGQNSPEAEAFCANVIVMILFCIAEMQCYGAVVVVAVVSLLLRPKLEF